MTDRAKLLVADLERIPGILRGHAAAGPFSLGSKLLGHGWESGPGRTTRLRRVVLTGLGSSRFAGLAIAAVLRDAGLDVVVEHASTAGPAPVDAGTLVVAISSSGGTRETLAAAGRARAAGASVLAITNRPDSPLADGATAVLPLAAGDEASGVASATYAATVAALVRLAEALGAISDGSRVLVAAAEAADAVLAGRDTWLEPAADLLDGGAAIHLLADARALGTAEQAALMFREGPRLDADATDAGDWLHVGIYTAFPGYRALLLAGTPYDAEVVETIRGRGGQTLAIGGPHTAPAGTAAAATAAQPPFGAADMEVLLPAAALLDPLVRAILEPIVCASLAAELWLRTTASDR